MQEMENGEILYGQLRVEKHNGHRTITIDCDGHNLAILNDDVPAQLQKDILAHVLGIEENPQAEKHFKEHELAKTVFRLCEDARALLAEYQVSIKD